jgi:hypothetical protein
MRKDVLLRLEYSGARAELTEVWLESFTAAGDRVDLVQLDHTLSTADRAALARAAALVAHVGQLEAF